MEEKRTRVITCAGCWNEVHESALHPNTWYVLQETVVSDASCSKAVTSGQQRWFCSLECLMRWVRGKVGWHTAMSD